MTGSQIRYNRTKEIEFNVIKDSDRWFKSRVIELILEHKPDMIKLLFPNFQIISLGVTNPNVAYLGKFPKERILSLPSYVIRHVQGVERGLGTLTLIPCSFAKFLSEIEISVLDKLYPIYGHPVFDFIGFRATPEESYNSTIDLNACYQYVTRPIWRIGEDATTFEKRRHELGEQYKNAIKILLKNEEERLGINIALLEKAIIELKSSSQKTIALSKKQRRLAEELICSGFKIYILLAQFKSNLTVDFTLYEALKV